MHPTIRGFHNHTQLSGKALAAGGATTDSHVPNIYLQRTKLDIELSGKALAAGGATNDSHVPNIYLQPPTLITSVATGDRVEH